MNIVYLNVFWKTFIDMFRIYNNSENRGLHSFHISFFIHPLKSEKNTEKISERVSISYNLSEFQIEIDFRKKLTGLWVNVNRVIFTGFQEK